MMYGLCGDRTRGDGHSVLRLSSPARRFRIGGQGMMDGSDTISSRLVVSSLNCRGFGPGLLLPNVGHHVCQDTADVPPCHLITPASCAVRLLDVGNRSAKGAGHVSTRRGELPHGRGGLDVNR